MSFGTQRAHSNWVELPEIGVKVNIVSGHVLRITDGKPVPVYRNRIQGTIQAVVPKNDGQKGLGKGRIHQLGRIILLAANGGSPFPNPRMGLAIAKDGSKWNIHPDNLEWVSRKEYMERKVMEGNFPLKLNGYTALTIKDVVKKLGFEGINDYDAIGSSFNIGGEMVNRIISGRSWGFVTEYLKGVTAKASDSQIHRVKEAVALYSDYDRELADYIANYSEAV